MLKYLLIGISGFAGANLRYLIQAWIAERWGASFPYGTLFINALGIITDGCLLKRASAGERAGVLQALGGRLLRSQGATIDLAKRTAAEVMTGHLVTVTPETPLLDALRLLLQHKIKRLPVVDGDGRVVGLVGRGEILQALAQDLLGA